MAGEIAVSVETMAGNRVWGPASVDASAPLSSLRDLLAGTMGVPPPAVHFVYEGRALQGGLAEEAIPDGAVLNCVLDMVKSSIEFSISKVKAALEAQNEGPWHLEALVSEAPVPNEEHCPNFRNVDWGKLQYKEITFMDEVMTRDTGVGGETEHVLKESFFGTVDPDGKPVGYGLILKQSTCSGECQSDYRGVYQGLFLPTEEDYTMPMCSGVKSMLLQGSYVIHGRWGQPETYFEYKNGLFDGTEEEMEVFLEFLG